MHAAFGTVLWIVCGASAVAAFVALATSGRNWEQYSRHHPDLAAPKARRPVDGVAERDAEIRQMLEARNARLRRRGQPPVDVERELARLTVAPPQIDDALRAEIRDLVVARNHRRARQGKPPLDVEAEIEREIAGLRDL